MLGVLGGSAFLGSGLRAEPVVKGAGLTDHPGMVLVSELSCTACHASEIKAKGGPLLGEVGERVRADYLEKYLADPRAVKPGTTMPDVFAGLAKEEREKKAKALTDYLVSLSGGQVEEGEIRADAAERGKVLYETVGCVACHEPEGKEIAGSVPLVGLGEKYGLGSLREFLKEPSKSRPSGRMPDMKLSHQEAEDLAAYLMRDRVGKGAAKVAERELTLVEEGKRIYFESGCVQCHDGGEKLANTGPDLKTLVLNDDCGSVKYGLSEKQSGEIRAWIQDVGSELSLADRVGVEMAKLNCLSCHERGGFGGVTQERDEYFTTTNLNLGEQARIPPGLNGVGAKLKKDWMEKVVILGESVRPYMTTRMPRHPRAEVEELLAWLGEVDQLEELKFQRVLDRKSARDGGHTLLGTDGLACVTCHTYLGESASTLAGLELTSMTERLQENWFHHFLRDPAKFQPGTIMPSFWPGGKAGRDDFFDGDAGMQVDAIWQFLEQGREGRQPKGIQREALEYGPTADEAVIFRRKYEGIGKRGIGVGYPADMNLAFDAEQMRVGTIWRGDFAEMSGVWRSQGSGNVREASRELVRFPVGPGFAKLTAVDEAWPTAAEGERVPGLEFLGYELDAKKRPTFRYRVDGVEVRDGFLDAEGTLERTISLGGEMKGWLMRVAAGEGLAMRDGVLVLPKGLRIQAAGLILREGAEGKEALLRMSGDRELKIKYEFQNE